MCLGHTHALSGLVTGGAVGLCVTHPHPLSQLALFTGLTAGAAVLPDIDHPNSSLAHCFGFLTKTFAALIGAISGGHRHLTHAILGVAGFTAAAWYAVRYRQAMVGKIGLGILLALIIASGLSAMSVPTHGAPVRPVFRALSILTPR